MRFNEHCLKSQVHKTATIRANQFRDYMENRRVSIEVMMNSQINEQIRINREKLVPIVEAIILCGRQNISLRGYRDDEEHCNSSSNNAGNLQAILTFMKKCDMNEVFNQHHLTASRNVTYHSKTTQNELISICGERIVTKLIDEVKSAKFFSVLADEAADISNTEQLSVVIRFVDQNANIRKEFMGFFPCNEGLSGEEICLKIKEAVSNIGLDMKNCRGKGYDGAGNMAGKCSGAAARIQHLYPKALYVHCRSHVLNLCVASACKIQLVKNMMSHVCTASNFFNVHPKHDNVLKDKIKLVLTESRHRHLIDVCRTRWLARIDGLEIFIELLPAIVSALEVIKDNADGSWNADSSSDASSLFFSTVSFQFTVTLVIISRCLEVTRPLTKQLQASDMDVVKTAENISLLSSILSSIRNDVDHYHESWYQEAVSLASLVHTVPSNPRITLRQTGHSNLPADSPSEYYRRSVSVPFLDHLQSEIAHCFAEKNLLVLNAFNGLPAHVISNSKWKEKFQPFLTEILDDLREPRYLATELQMWEEYWKQFTSKLPADLHSLLPLIDKLTYTNLYTAFQILSTIPVTTCSCERSISVLRRLKTYLRNSMSQERLNALAMLHVHRDIDVDAKEVIDHFARRHPRRMKLFDILNTDPE